MTTIAGNNIRWLVLDILMVLAYLIQEINEFMHKQGGHVALLDQALDIN